MPCPLCGDICRCSSDAHAAAPPRWLADATPIPATPTPELEAPPTGALCQPPAAELSTLGDDNSNEPAPEDSTVWRQEVAARLNRYQARRKPRPPRYPSLRLSFDEEDHGRATSGMADPAFQQRITTASNQALALDGFVETEADAIEVPAAVPAESAQPMAPATAPVTTPATGPITGPVTTPATGPITGPVTGKIIEFPRSWTPPVAPLDELAEPVSDRPRILEAPEVVPPPPALGGITIEPARQPEFEKRPGIDIPLQSAPLGRRIFSAAVDDVVIAAACVLFAFIFWKLTAIRPPQLQLLGLVVGLSAVFWAAYQYLLVTYSGTTPGLLLARLELARFDGSPAGRRLRRWRVLASFLSAVSLGMGYAWVFLDEDSLCWHDRITHTYLAPRNPKAKMPDPAATNH
jgi:uncharacterized RDD family membrane protein YckC